MGQQVEAGELQDRGGQGTILEVGAARRSARRAFRGESLRYLLANDGTDADLERHLAEDAPYRCATSRASRSLVAVSTCSGAMSAAA